jgi:hypothetical protein
MNIYRVAQSISTNKIFYYPYIFYVGDPCIRTSALLFSNNSK